MQDTIKIDPSQFEFVQKEKFIKDEKIETKKIGYFKDALIRFTRNKASVAAFVIIILLVIYSIVGPYIGNQNYIVNSYDSRRLGYSYTLPKLFNTGFGFWDGTEKQSVNQNTYNRYYAIYVETSRNGSTEDTTRNPITKVYSNYLASGVQYYDIRYDSYAGLGMQYLTVTEAEYLAIQEWQNETGIQVIYPAVNNSSSVPSVANDPNIWYQLNQRNQPDVTYDENGNPIFIETYNTTSNDGGYNSLRIDGDDGSYKYAKPSGSSGYQIRVDKNAYFTYSYGGSPRFIFGTDTSGYDIFTRLARAGRFSFLLAIFVSALNLIIGALYGAIEGYFGGTIDLVMERICDILGNVPFMVVTTLFQLHLASKVGVVPSLLFAFVLTGWIGTAATTRMQFYRYKNQEYVMAARTLGASNKRLMFKHIFPNAIGTLITSSVLVIPSVIFSESSLTYLGIVNLDSAEQTSVGTMLANARGSLQNYPHIILFPALFISLLMITFNLFGNGLRDAFNPSLRGADE